MRRRMIETEESNTDLQEDDSSNNFKDFELINKEDDSKSMLQKSRYTVTDEK
jgi:hypothetical protein